MGVFAVVLLTSHLAASGGDGEGPVGSDLELRRDSALAAGVGGDPVADERGLPGTSDWKLRRPARARQIEGFADHVSVVSGRPVTLKVSTRAPRYRVEAYRFGAYRGGWARRVWASRSLDGRRQRGAVFRPRSTRTIVAPWRRSVTVQTDGWAPGLYVFKLVASTGWQSWVPLTVRSRSARGKVAVVTPVTTWQAYNDWGGYSLYRGPSGDRRSWAVSFDRPYPEAGAGQMMSGSVPVVVRAEKLGIPLAYFTNVDLEAHPRALRGARGYVSTGHDEYWSPAMRRAVTRARNHGANLAFFGANTMYWRVRFARTGSGPNRRMIGYRHDAFRDPLFDRGSPRTTARWRDRPAPRPENSLVGMLYECFPVHVPYRVVSPGWWGFRGTGVRDGERFANLVGHEADRVYPVRSTPRPLQILSNVRYSCGGVSTSSQSVYYTTPSGAGVFTAGTLNWACALKGSCVAHERIARKAVPFTRRVTDSILRAYARGPVGRRLPARDNVARFDLPRRNQVPAS